MYLSHFFSIEKKWDKFVKIKNGGIRIKGIKPRGQALDPLRHSFSEASPFAS